MILKQTIATSLLISFTACAAFAADAGSTADAGSAAPAGAVSGSPGLVLQGRTELPDYTGDFDHLAADPGSNRLLLAAEDHGTLEVFNLKTGQHLRTVTGFETPHSIHLIPGKHRILISDGSTTLKLLDYPTLAHAGEIKLHPGADSFGLDESTGHLYIVTGGKDVKMKDSWLEELDPQTGKQLGAVHFDADHVEALAVEQHGPNAYINVTDKNELDVIDKHGLAIKAKWPIHEATENALVQLDEETRRLFIVTRDPARMLVLDADSGKTLASFKAPGHADGEVFDAANQRVYVTGGEGWIGEYQEIDSSHFVELPRVSSAAGAKTVLLVSDLHRLYVGVSPGERKGGALLWFDVKPGVRPH
jgi:hypothetical protein